MLIQLVLEGREHLHQAYKYKIWNAKKTKNDSVGNIGEVASSFLFQKIHSSDRAPGILRNPR